MRRAATIITILAVVLIAGWAFAQWLVDSNVTGYSRMASLQPMTSLDISATIPADLTPGQTGPLHFKLVNPNSNSLTVTDLLSPQWTVNGPGACASSNVTVTAASGLSIVVPGGSVPTAVDIPGIVSLASGAPTSCQGDLVTVNATLRATT
jgi:hypothetical protein